MQRGGGPPPSECAAPELAAPISARPPLFGNCLPPVLGEDPGWVGGEGGSGGSASNRWPRQETMALLKIRSDMDAAFRDSTLKGPLWEEVSRNMMELGYNRSAKKCREKFENVYKYYKRTKGTRAGGHDGKSYRFFSQLEALHSSSSSVAMVDDNVAAPLLPLENVPTCSPTMANYIARSQLSLISTLTASIAETSVVVAAAPPQAPTLTTAHLAASPQYDAAGLSYSSNTSSFSETESEGDGGRRRRKRRKMMSFLEGLIQKVMDGQEAMLQRFLDAMERREQDRMIREEAWRRQENRRISREHEHAAQDRAAAASRDDAIISFLQKLTGQKIPIPPPPQPLQTTAEEEISASPPPPPATGKTPASAPDALQVAPELTSETLSSRWPKPEVQALIRLRSGMEERYQDSGPKGPLWEEISAGMRRLGFYRSAKRCKEKWENINKYFKKVKESNKKRPEDAKTCPYFHQLDALYRSKLLGADGRGSNGDFVPQTGFFEHGSSSTSLAKKNKNMIEHHVVEDPKNERIMEEDNVDREAEK